MASVFSSLNTVELSDEEAGAVDAVFCSALGMSCSWVLARPRLKRNKGRKFFFCFLKEDFFMTHIRALSLITHGEAPETFNLEIRKCQLSFWEYTNIIK